MNPINLGHDLTTDKGEQQSRQPWTDEEVKTLLEASNLRQYTAFRSPNGRTDYLPWLIVLSLYTGARRNELMGLRTEDVIEIDHKCSQEMPVLRIVPHDDRRLKSPASQRRVPIHPDLIQLGLFDWLRRRQQKGRRFLLDLPSGRSSKGAYGKPSDRFRGYSQALGLHVKNVKVLHSFRNSMEVKLMGLTESAHDREVILGHMHGDMADNYNERMEMDLSRHYDLICQIDWGLNLKELKQLLAKTRLQHEGR